MDEEKESREPGGEFREMPQTEDQAVRRIFVVGMGQTGRELISRIERDVELFGVDVDPRKLDKVRSLEKKGNITLCLRDGTSRLTWKALGLREDDTVVSVTPRDETNLEVARVTREYARVRQVIGLLNNLDYAEGYSKAGMETITRPRVIASFIENRLFRDRRTATNIGLGQGEIMEVPVLPGSSVIGRRLRTFRARPWLVGAVYRNDNLIVPHGNTVIKEGDRVLLIGEPHILNGIADFFKMGEPDFPLQYGPKIGVLPVDAKGERYEELVSESNFLARNSRATSMVMLTLPGVEEPDLDMADKICGGTAVTCEPAFFSEEEERHWPKRLQAQDFGCLVMQPGRFGLARRLGIVNSLLIKILEEADYPILLSRGTFPYEKILAPVSTRFHPVRIVQLAVDLARLFDARLEAVTVTEPAFSAGKDAVEEQRRMVNRLVEYSELYNLKVKINYREGNPIKETVKMAEGYDLMVLGHRKGSRGFFPRLDIALEIIARVGCSVMILPYAEEAW